MDAFAEMRKELVIERLKHGWARGLLLQFADCALASGLIGWPAESDIAQYQQSPNEVCCIKRRASSGEVSLYLNAKRGSSSRRHRSDQIRPAYWASENALFLYCCTLDVVFKHDAAANS